MTFREVQLQDILDIQWGDTKTTKSSYVEDGYLAYSASGPDGFLEKYDYDCDAVVLSAIGANCGTTFYASGKWSCIKNTIRILPKSSEIDLKYFYFMTKTPNFWPLRGSAQPFISQTDIREMFVSVPDLHTQKAIGEIIFNLELAIQSKNLIAMTLEKIAQSIFKSWFIDFDPVKAKMAGEKPAGMDDATAAFFPDSMEDSEIGQIPTGWSVQDFGEVNHLLMGQSPPGDTYNSEGEGAPFYQGRTDFGIRFPKKRVFCTAGTRFAKAGEVLISVRAPVGDLNQAIEDCVIGRGVASAMHKSGSHVYSYALLCSLKSRLVYYNGEGTVFGAINRSDFHSLKVLEPPRHVVDLFETVAGPLNDEIRNLFNQTESLIELRDSLLPRLISGELQIPEEMLMSS